MTLATEKFWEYEFVDDITLGVDVSKTAEKIDNGAFSSIKNMFYHEGRLLTDSGYATFLGTVRGNPRAKIQFTKKNGSSEDLLITNSTVYISRSSQWQYVPARTPTTLTVGAIAGATSVTVANTAGFANGDYIGIELDSGQQHQTTVNSAPVGFVITITDALPTAAGIGNDVLEPVLLTGDDDSQVSWDIMPAFDYLLFTNNNDVPQYYNGTLCQDMPNLVAAGVTACRAIKIFVNHVVLLGTLEGGTSYPQRVRWSDTADPTTWIPADNNTAGYEDLYDDESFIVDGAVLGPYFIVYKGTSIVRTEFVGTTERLFNFDTVITTEGLLATNCVIDLGSEHAFAGANGIYRYQGAFELVDIDEKIWPQMYSKDKELDPTQAPKTSFMAYIQELDEAWFFYPRVDATYPDKLARYNFIEKAWTFREFSIEITGYGFHKNTTSLRWADLVGSWLVQTFRWGSSSASVGSPTIILLSGTGSKQAYEYDYVTSTDNGTAIAWEFITKEFFHPQHSTRTNWLDFQAKGSSVTIEYSKDGGITFRPWGTVALTTDYKRYRKHKQIVSDRIRWKFSGTSSDFGFEWFGFQYRQESLK